ncbi:MAG TPA: cyclase family protein [Actinoplanes sp.]
MVDLSHEIRSDELGGDTGGTRLDAPFHLYPDRADLARVPLERLVSVSIVVVRAYARLEIAVDDLGDPGVLWGKAVLLYTGRARHRDLASPRLAGAAVGKLIDANVALVGLDSGIDEPARQALLGNDIPIVEHLTNLDRLPDTGARLTVLPPPVREMASFAVRAVAVIPSGPNY